MEARVVGYALPPEQGADGLYHAARVECGIESIFGDVRELDGLLAALAVHEPEIVFHLAAQPLVRRSYREPVETLTTNVMGTAHLLDAVRRTRSVRAVVIVTSDKCYENREWAWGYREDEPLGGHDPYSASKACAELVARAYRQSYFSGRSGPAVATARAGNVIGGGDWSPDRLVPDIVRAIANDRPVVLRNPDAVRPWQHVLDPLHGYLQLAQRLAAEGGEFADSWNFGPNDDCVTTVGELAERLIAHWGRGRLRVERETAAPHEAHTLRLDCSKARARLGWRPLLSLDDALRLTVDWTRAHLEDNAAEAALHDQIDEYLERVSGGVACR